MKFVLLICLFIGFVQCTSKKNNVNEVDFEMVPYVAMVQTELQLLDSTPLAIMVYNIDTAGNVKDSSFLDKKDFKKVAEKFITPDISKKGIKKHYIEKSYGDVANDSYNFTYTTKEEDQPIKMVIVTTSAGDNSRFKTLLLTKSYTQKDTLVIENLFWYSGKYCTITTTKQVANYSNTTMQKLAWGMQ